MPRHVILDFLLRKNKELNLYSHVWGHGAVRSISEFVNAIQLNVDSVEPPAYPIITKQGNFNYSYHTTFYGLYQANHFAPQVDSKKSSDLELNYYKNLQVCNWGGYCLILHEGKLVSQLSSVYAPLSLLSELSFHGIKSSHIDQAYLIADDSDPNNYCHFVLDYLSQLYFLTNVDYYPTIIFLENQCNKFQSFFYKKIESLGYEIKFLKEGESVEIEKLYMLNAQTRFTHPAYGANPSVLKFLRTYVPLTSSPNTREVLWVSRRDRRRLTDEETIIKELAKQYQVTITDLDGLTPYEQAELFDTHRIIIGVHGAAFTNLAFTNSQQRCVVELFARGNGTPSFAILCDSLGYPHFSIIGDLIETKHANYPDLIIDCEELMKLLSNFHRKS